MYNSVPTSVDELNSIRKDMQDELAFSDYEDVNVTISDVSKALTKLNHGKRDGTLGTYSDHFINCSDTMKILITKLINAMIVHGFTPNDLLEAVVVSIPKDLRGNLCADDNYRGIALCSALCKVIDLIFMDKYSDLIITSDLQFAYKENHSTNMCTTVLKEVCSYYVSNNSDVYICLLDASKAFDRVHYGKIFNLLKLRKIPVLVRRLLLDMYTRQSIKAAWNSKLSESCSSCSLACTKKMQHVYLKVQHVKICYISHASGPRGPDLVHMYLICRPYTTLITLCIGQYEVTTHATCL